MSSMYSDLMDWYGEWTLFSRGLESLTCGLISIANSYELSKSDLVEFFDEHVENCSQSVYQLIDSLPEYFNLYIDSTPAHVFAECHSIQQQAFNESNFISKRECEMFALRWAVGDAKIGRKSLWKNAPHLEFDTIYPASTPLVPNQINFEIKLSLTKI